MNYRRLVSDDSFIGRYMDFMDAQETAQAYDFWSAVWLIGSAMGVNVIVDRPRAPVHMNWYVILAADSGITRKSTAVNYAARILEATQAGDLPVNTLQGKTTPERLEEIMAELTLEHGHSWLAISVSELVTFMGRERYTLAMPGLLTDLYDCPRQRHSGGTKKIGSTRADNIYVSFLSASTPAWLTRAVNPDVVEGGFTSRCMFITAYEPKKLIAWPEDINVSERVADFAIELIELHRRAVAYGTIKLNDTARETFTKWYRGRKLSDDPFQQSFESREDAHILRLAATLAISDRRYQIDANDIKRAIKVIMLVKAEASVIFSPIATNSRLLPAVTRVRDFLIKCGADGCSQTRLVVSCWKQFKSQELKILLETMLEFGMVQKFENIRINRLGRPATYWRATNQLASPNAIETIMEALEPTMEL